MLNIFKDFYLKVKLSPGITALYSNIIIDQIGSGLVGIFMPIFLWQKFGNLNYVLLYYLGVHFIYIFTAFIGAKIMSQIGQKIAMILSVPFKVLFFVCLYYLALDYSVIIFTGLMMTVIEIRIMLFWVPYHTDFAGFTNKRTRGRVIGFLSAIASLVSIFIPVISGWIIASYGFEILFLMSVLLMAVSIIPLFLVKPTYEKFVFSFRDTWQTIFSRKYRRIFGSYFADGVENIVGVIIWPIFIFQIMRGDFLKVGLISSLIVLVSVAFKLIMGSFTDKINKRNLIKFGSALYAAGWLFKIFVATTFQIFIASTYHNFAAIIMRTPFDALAYEKAADSGHYVDEYTVLREMSLNMGRVACIVILFILINVIGLQWTFVLAG